MPFSAEQFYQLFRDYNQAIWPAQLLLQAMAMMALLLLFRPGQRTDRLLSGWLAALWIWAGLAYHLAFFTRLNPLAYLFAAMSLVGAGVLIWQGLVRQRLHFGWSGTSRALLGGLLLAFALVIYPLWSWLAGHAYPFMPTFGAPCPVTLYTIGLLAFLVPPHPRSPLVVPLIWCVVGAQAAFLLGVPQDTGLILAGGIAVVLMLPGRRKRE